MSCYLVQEVDGVSRFTLEDGSGFLLLEDCTPVVPPQPGIGGKAVPGSDRRRRRELDDAEWLAVVLGEM